MKEKPFDHNLNAIIYPNIVERWGLLEISVKGISSGNPFTERTIHGMFTGSQECIQTDGFYDGNGIYKIRFMPSFEGSYTFQLKGNFTNETFHGSLRSVPPERKTMVLCESQILGILSMKMVLPIMLSEPHVTYGTCSQMN